MATMIFSECYITHGKLDADTPLMSECTTSHMLGSLLFIIMGLLLMPPPCSNSVTSVSCGIIGATYKMVSNKAKLPFWDGA